MMVTTTPLCTIDVRYENDVAALSSSIRKSRSLVAGDLLSVVFGLFVWVVAAAVGVREKSENFLTKSRRAAHSIRLIYR